jgi:hypothetical protein
MISCFTGVAKFINVAISCFICVVLFNHIVMICFTGFVYQHCDLLFHWCFVY